LVTVASKLTVTALLDVTLDVTEQPDLIALALLSQMPIVIA